MTALRQPPIPAAGRIDLHCHLLPGVDDGCRTVRQSLECVSQWKDAGFVGAVCTPHLGPGYYPGNTPDNIADWLDEFRGELERAELDFQLWDGGEVRMAEETIEWFSYWGLPTLGPGKCVLLDFWGREWPDYCYDTCQFLLDNSYQPIVAHPERLACTDDDFESLVDRLLEMGVWLQGNLNSIGGGEGQQARQRALRLLQEGRYYALATDTHGPADLAERLAIIDMVLAEVGEETLRDLLETRQREILTHGAIEES